METEVWVANASPLIFLGKAGLRDLLLRLAPSVVIPVAVRDEIAAGVGGLDCVIPGARAVAR